jgi:hypothetical protein
VEAERSFLIQPQIMRMMTEDWDTQPSEVLEIAIHGVPGGPEQRELDESLKSVRGLKVAQYEVKALDVPMLVAVAGSLASLVQAADILLKWWTQRRESGKGVRLEIRTEEGGKLDLSTSTVEEARKLLADVAKMLDQRQRSRKAKAKAKDLPPASQ